MSEQTKAAAAALCLHSAKFAVWAEAQRANLAKFAPSLRYLTVTEEQLRANPQTFTQYEETARLLYANRPKAILGLFKQGFDEVLHLGADVHFYAHFMEQLRALPGDIVATPHITKPMPLDGARPTTMQIHMTGQLNSDFVLYRNKPRTIAFLEWMAAAMEVKCSDDISSGHFFDQVYLSYAPYFTNCYILKKPGFNVAYWNLQERELFRDLDGKWRVAADQQQLVCFQFSGFDPDKWWQLSKYNKRPSVQTLEALTLCKEFSECLKLSSQQPGMEHE